MLLIKKLFHFLKFLLFVVIDEGKTTPMQLNFLLSILFATSLAQAAIYGPDNRLDIHQIPSMRTIAKSVAASIPKNFLKQNADGTYSITDVEMAAGSSTINLCPNERFANQPTVSNCSGFVVGDRYLITAGHCVLPNGIVDNDEKNPFCEGFSWYLDFNLKSTDKAITQNIPKDRIYHCKKMIRAENIEISGLPEALKFGNDFAVIELDRPLASDIKPLKVSGAPLAKNDQVFTLGHPTGLPAKFSGYSPVMALTTPRYFEVALDSQGGNSGGPVFNTKKEVVGILVSGHQVDYFDDVTGCSRPNRCNANGTKCLKDSKPEHSYLQTTNFVQYISAALPWVPGPVSGHTNP